MNFLRAKTTGFPLMNVVFVIIPIMFIITILLNFSFLSKLGKYSLKRIKLFLNRFF